MAFSQFPPAASGGGASVAAFAVELAAKNVTNGQTQAFDTGSYTITCAPTSTDVIVAFVDATSVITTQSTVTGVISFTLASPATKVFITAKNNATVFPTIVSIEKTANSLTSTDIGNGTLDTINATGAYNQTGLLAVLAISGGEFGSMGGSGYGDGGVKAGGNPGHMKTGIVFTNTATTVTIGAKGVARNTVAGSDTAATNTSFGNLVVADSTPAFIGKGAGGNDGTRNQNGNVGNANQTFPSWNTTGTSGGGGSGNGSQAGSTARGGGGSGIGTGGAGGASTGADHSNNTPNAAGQDATGKGAGGGAGPSVGGNHANNALRMGGDGSDGVVYVLRGF